MYFYIMRSRISISTVRKANDKMGNKVVVPKTVGSSITISVRTGKLNKSYDISNEKINNAYKLAKAK